MAESWFCGRARVDDRHDAMFNKASPRPQNDRNFQRGGRRSLHVVTILH